MKRQRIAGIEKEILRVVSKLFLEEIKNPKLSGIVSVIKVDITEDLKFADIYFSILPSLENTSKTINKKEILENLNQIKSFLRKRISEEIEIRYTPEIRPKIDDSMENAMRITKLLNELKI